MHTTILWLSLAFGNAPKIYAESFKVSESNSAPYFKKFHP